MKLFSRIRSGILIVFVCTLLFLVCDFFGIIWHNDFFASHYTVKGLDVSHHQGTIDWGKVAAQKKYAFVYMKATEGHDFIDDAFQKNWTEAKKNGFLVGAYHFFSTRSTGAEQAQYFISTVPYDPVALPPVIDLEIDVHKEKTMIQKELDDLVTALERRYQKKPIFYVTYETYQAYVEGYFDSYDIWIRDIFFIPRMNRNWTIWQYNNRGHVNGISGNVDINAFYGNEKELLQYAQ